MRRSAPRPLAQALAATTAAAAPQTLLAMVQTCWEEVAGPAVATEAWPVAERAGKVTFECSSAAWAQELELLGPDLVEGLNAALADAGAGRVRAIRARSSRRR